MHLFRQPRPFAHPTLLHTLKTGASPKGNGDDDGLRSYHGDGCYAPGDADALGDADAEELGFVLVYLGGQLRYAPHSFCTKTMYRYFLGSGTYSARNLARNCYPIQVKWP